MGEAVHEGQLIAGRYELLERIGEGRADFVWRARDRRLDRDVAVKRGRMSGRVKRVLLRWRHPHIVELLDTGTDENGPWLVMEYVAGLSLDKILDRDQRLPVNRVAKMGAQIASALAFMHAKGVLHRDVKPSNIIVLDDGTAKLADFDISHVMWGDPTMTGGGSAVGTAAYMAKEVAEEERATEASDVFALGAALFAAVEGVPVYGPETNVITVLNRARRGEVSRPVRAGPLAPILRALLETSPELRPTAAAAQRMLEEVSGVPVGSVPATSTPRGGRRRRAVTVSALVSAVVVLVAGGLVVWQMVDGRSAGSTGRGRPAPPAAVSLVGDHRTADPCALIKPAAFARFGEAKLNRGYGNFDRCDVLVDRNGGNVEVDVEVSFAAGPPETLPQPAQKVGPIGIAEPPAQPGECSRAVLLPKDADPDTVVWVDVDADARAPLCDMADVAARGAAGELSSVAAQGGHLPRRSPPLPHDSLVWQDACKLLDAHQLVAAVPSIDAGDGKADFGGWGCTWGSGNYAGLLFDRNSPLTAEDGRPIRLDGRKAFVTPKGDGADTCTVRVEYRTYIDDEGDPAVEILRLFVHGSRPMDRLCTAATALAGNAAARLPR